MAAVDKIYGTKEQYNELRDWCSANYPKALDYFYDWSWDDNGIYPVTNFPVEVDGYLVLCCDIAWVVDQIREQYGLDDTLEQQIAALVEVCKTVIDSLIPEDERNDGDPLFEDAKVFDAYELAQQALAQVEKNS